MIDQRISELLAYGHKTGLLGEGDEIYARNQLLEVMGLSDFEEPEELSAVVQPGEAATEDSLATILDELVEDAAKRGVFEPDSLVFRDLFDTKLMNCLLPRPSEVRSRFAALAEKSIEEATDWYYRFSQDTNYIRRDRIRRDVKWTYESAYGAIDITINLAKPEKDPKAIAAALTQKQSSYPKCQLCKEAEGYAGRADYPGRQTHRVIPLTMGDEPWFFQYSPYTYYNEHAIVFSATHRPMVVSRASMARLLDFVTIFPHYFLGSNADLPIVGGSILTHDHFQGGRYEFAMERAEAAWTFDFPAFPDVEAEVVKWPMAVLRLRSRDQAQLLDLADLVLRTWRAYSDPACEILAFTGETPHNTITPIARRKGEAYELDLVLRNNRTTEARPLGLFHPRDAYHHIKKENIGLIEVMGLAVLPSRLKSELAEVATCLVSGSDPLAKAATSNHAPWISELREKYERFDESTVEHVVEEETALVFVKVLEDAGVYKQTEDGQAGFARFLQHCEAEGQALAAGSGR